MAGDVGIREQVIVLGPGKRAAEGQLERALEPLEARVLHHYGSRVKIAEVPDGREEFVREEIPFGGLAATPEALPEAIAEGMDPLGEIGLAALRMRQSDDYLQAKASRPRDGEEWDSPDATSPDAFEEGSTSFEAPIVSEAGVPEPTSTRMVGSVAVGILIVEGPTAALQFSDVERTKVVAEVQNGLSWLAAQNPAGRLSWHYDIKRVPLSVAPGSGGGSLSQLELLWRDPAMQSLGYSTGIAGVNDYVHDLRLKLGTQWAYCAFFTKYPLGHFAYALAPRLVMAYANNGWGPDNIDRVFAHETGHVFGAPDEYASSGCDCGGSHGWFGTPNGNCANCAPGGGVRCIMRSNRWELCPHTPSHFGWGAFEERLDAALWRNSNGKIYLFSGDQYVRFTRLDDGIDAGYPKPIKDNWPGLPDAFNDGIDAALMRESNGKIYFFKGDQYVRYSRVSSGIDSGYPKPIKDNWPGLPDAFNTGINAAFWRRSNGKIYFFKGNQYIRYTRVSDGVDAGYPKPIAGNWPGLPPEFEGGIDAALMRRSNGKIYFFKDREYIRYSQVSSGIDPGYPRSIHRNWMPFPE